MSAQTSAVASFGLARSSVLSGPVASPRECSFLLEASVHAATAQTAAWDEKHERDEGWVNQSNALSAQRPRPDFSLTAREVVGQFESGRYGVGRLSTFLEKALVSRVNRRIPIRIV
jgi:hypothetical protein